MFKLTKNKRSPIILVGLILIWTISIGIGLATARETNNISNNEINNNFQLGKELYLENCATCHIGVPPEVLPTETWRRLLQDKQHYGVEIKPPINPPRLLIWNYLQTLSRPQGEGEEIAYRVAKSRYFQAIHPRVKMPRDLQLSTCITCHPGVKEYNFRQLTPEWENSP